MNNLVGKNDLGFYELLNKPSEEELADYYSTKYYQEEHAIYRSQYSREELQFFDNKNEQRYQIISELQSNGDRFLDIGCGEGYMLEFFRKKDWTILGLNFSEFGCSKMNPQSVPYLMVGNIYENMRRLEQHGETFDVIALTNVLEHVLDPIALLKNIRELSHKDSILVITVPNDFSLFQKFLTDQNFINDQFWVAAPDHISYFEKNSLEKACEFGGWLQRDLIADFPIDLFLANKQSNYVLDRSKGKDAHLSRIKLDNYLSGFPLKDVNNFYRGMAKVGLGRNIIGFYKIKE